MPIKFLFLSIFIHPSIVSIAHTGIGILFAITFIITVINFEDIRASSLLDLFLWIVSNVNVSFAIDKIPFDLLEPIIHLPIIPLPLHLLPLLPLMPLLPCPPSPPPRPNLPQIPMHIGIPLEKQITPPSTSLKSTPLPQLPRLISKHHLC